MTIVVIDGGIVQNVYGDDVIVVDRDKNAEEPVVVYFEKATAGVEGFCADIDMEEPELCVRVRDMMGRPPGV